jgi:hypothetical protein
MPEERISQPSERSGYTTSLCPNSRTLDKTSPYVTMGSGRILCQSQRSFFKLRRYLVDLSMDTGKAIPYNPTPDYTHPASATGCSVPLCVTTDEFM